MSPSWQLVFAEVYRVLRNDGTCWLNLGNSYSSGGNGVGSGKQLTNVRIWMPAKKAPDGFKVKELLGIPWRVAFALQADGWYLRSAIDGKAQRRHGRSSRTDAWIT